MPRKANFQRFGKVMPGKRYPLNLRMTFEVRQRLEHAADRTGRSLAQELEYRLTRSFEQEDVHVRLDALLTEIRAWRPA